jgi:hypothetical protein
MMTRWLMPTALALAALIHLLPLPGLFGAAQLQALYGLGEIDATSLVLLRHRALMFALFGVLLLAAFRIPSLRFASIAVVLVSDVGFLLLALAADMPAALQRVALADGLSIVLLLIAALAMRRGPGGRGERG